VAAGLIGAIIWDLLTWWWALPTSSSHALLVGLAGAAIVKAGFGSLDAGLFIKTALFIVISPAMALVLGAFMMRLVMAIVGRPSHSLGDRDFRRLDVLSAALYSIGAGGGAAEQAAGVIAGALIATGYLHAGDGSGPDVAVWGVLACQAAMGLGTL